MDLFTALHLEIRNGSIASFAEDGQTTVNFTEPLGVAAGFVHKVNVRSDVPPVQQKLRRLPFAVRDAVSQELERLESEGIIEKVACVTLGCRCWWSFKRNLEEFDFVFN